jgi:hypothetical protein
MGQLDSTCTSPTMAARVDNDRFSFSKSACTRSVNSLM